MAQEKTLGELFFPEGLEGSENAGSGSSLADQWNSGAKPQADQGGAPARERTLGEMMFPGLKPPEQVKNPPSPLARTFFPNGLEDPNKPAAPEPGADPANQGNQPAGEMKLIEVENPDLVPVASDSYTIPIEGANPELVGFLKTTAHELGMTRRQTAAIAQRYDAMVQKKMAADAAGYNQAFIGSLQKAWGEGFQNNINTAIEYSTQLQQDMPALGELLGGHKDAAIAYLLNELATAKGFKKTLGQTFFPNGLAK